MIESATPDDRENLLTTLRSRRRLYLSLYFIQIAAWLAVVIIYEVRYAEPTPVIKHAIDIAITMSFISPGVFVSTIFLVDVVIDGIIDLAKRGWEIMGLLFTPRKVRNIWQERGEKIGEERGEKIGEERGLKIGESRAKAEFADWYARMKQAEKEGADFDEPPPFFDDDTV